MCVCVVLWRWYTHSVSVKMAVTWSVKIKETNCDSGSEVLRRRQGRKEGRKEKKKGRTEKKGKEEKEETEGMKEEGSEWWSERESEEDGD